MTRSD